MKSLRPQKNKNAIPENFDILCAGFLCQAFSIIGYQKRLTDIRGRIILSSQQGKIPLPAKSKKNYFVVVLR